MMLGAYLNNKKACWILVLLCFLVYFNALQNGFVSDDFDTIAKNPLLARPPLYFWLYPSTVLNFLVFPLAKLNPFPYHLINIVLHSLATVAVFFFLRLFFNREASFFSSCFFAVHPIHAEAVTWISGRPYIMMTLFSFAVYFLYYEATCSVNPFKKKGGGDFNSLRGKDLVQISFKPAPYFWGLGIFIYYIIYNFNFFFLFPFFLALSDISLGLARRNWKRWIPFFVISGMRILLALQTVSKRVADVRIDVGVSQVKNPIVYFLYSFFSHLRFFSLPDKLTFYHDPSFAPMFLLTQSVWILLPIVILLFLAYKKAREVFFGMGIFILFLAPTFSPIPIAGLVCERYVYMPSVGLGICLAYLFEKASQKSPSWRGFMIGLFVAAVFGYGMRTFVRNQDWKTQDLFWEKTLKASPFSPRARNNMGTVYIKEKKFDQAIKEFETAIQFNAEYALAYFNLGDLYTTLGENEKAVDFYHKSIQLRPWYQNTHNNLGALFINMGKNEEAIPALLKAIELAPDFPAAHFNLSVAYYNIGNDTLAILHYRIAEKLGYEIPAELSDALKPLLNKK
jgi:protein O-mannosyl-transferase